nr:hypothetical protein [uncultured Pseudomonas sp.]
MAYAATPNLLHLAVVRIPQLIAEFIAWVEALFQGEELFAACVNLVGQDQWGCMEKSSEQANFGAAEIDDLRPESLAQLHGLK